MTKITINEKEYDVIENWLEMGISDYFKLIDLYEQQHNGSIIEEEFLMKFIPLISTLTEEELLNMYEDDLLLFTDILSKFSIDTFQKTQQNTFTFNDVKYVVVLPSKLTNGENISIKLLEKGSNGPADTILSILSILIRPAIEKTNEFGEVYYEAVPFVGDMDILNKRKELFKNIPAANALWIIEAFTAGRK